MKTLILAVLLLAVNAQAQTNITTLFGVTYTNAVIQRADPDGVVVEYSASPGSVAIAKLKFSILPPEIGQRYGYNPQAARVFEQNQASGSHRTLTDAQRQKELNDYFNAEWSKHERKFQAEQARIAAVKAEQQSQAAEADKLAAALKADEERRQKLADDAYMQRWRIQDNQFDSMQRSLKNIERRLGR